MDSPDPRSAVKRIVDVMRRITRLVQIIPFVYLAFYALMLLTEHFTPQSILDIEDALLMTSPGITAVFLLLSRVLKLCLWHKTACLLPMSTQITNGIDCFVLQFTQVEVVLINTIIGLGALVFLILAYRHFFAR